jgi:hypothetical protein
MTRKIALALVGAATLAVAAVQAAGAPAASSVSSVATLAQISVVAKQSFCLASGISDYYTGDGKVTFYMTLHNTGSRGKVNIVPVRHYSDGSINESAMDMLIDVAVPGYSVKKYRSPAYKYKAHEHEVIACGLRINGGREVRIKRLHA